MTTREYIWTDEHDDGHRGWDLIETGPGGHRTVRLCVLNPPEGVLDDILRLVRRAYRDGREDRSAEMPPWHTGGQQSPAEAAVDGLLAIIYGLQDADAKRAALIAEVDQMLAPGGPPQPGQKIELALRTGTLFELGWSGRVLTVIVDEVGDNDTGVLRDQVTVRLHEITDEETEALAAEHDRNQRESARAAGIEF